MFNLEKSLYIIKQYPKYLYLKYDTLMVTNKFTNCKSDHCVYFKKINNGNYVILLLYVNDMLALGISMHDIIDIK